MQPTQPPATPAAQRRGRGFSLVELLVTLSVLGTLAALATPSFVTLLQASSLSTASNEFLGGVRLARSEALRRGGRVAMCKSADGANCTQAGGWEQGWIMFHDVDHDGERGAGEEVIVRGSSARGGLLLFGNQPVARVISFAPTGGPRTPNGAFLAGTVTLCQRSAQPVPGRQIVMSSVGRVRIQQVTLDSCSGVAPD
jgi:type IV fimbrial biogenesis protein FimT